MLHALIDQGMDVIGVDDFSTGTRENLAPHLSSITFIEGDLANPAIAAKAVAGVDKIIHLASIPSVPRSLENPVESVHASILATVTLLDAARKAGVKRVVQAASSSAYGDVPTTSRAEDTPPTPISPYAVAKLTQEYYGRVFSHCYEIDCVSLRYFNVFGPGQNPNSPYSAVIPKFIATILAGGQPVIFGDGTQCRDFTYIDNVVHGNLLAARHPDPLRGLVMNIACGESISLNQLVEKLAAITGVNVRPVHAETRLGDIHSSQADISRARNILKYAPIVCIDEGLTRTTAYFKSTRSPVHNEG